MSFYFARLFFFPDLRRGGWRGVGRGKGRIPIVFCVSACSALCLLAPSALALERGSKKKTRGAQCHLVLQASESLLGAFLLPPLRILPRVFYEQLSRAQQEDQVKSTCGSPSCKWKLFRGIEFQDLCTGCLPFTADDKPASIPYLSQAHCVPGATGTIVNRQRTSHSLRILHFFNGKYFYALYSDYNFPFLIFSQLLPNILPSNAMPSFSLS